MRRSIQERGICWPGGGLISFCVCNSTGNGTVGERPGGEKGIRAD